MSSLPTVAERVVELLDTAGVDVVFGIGGTHTLPLLGAFERRRAPRFVAARNEQGAAYMATGYARATGRPGVVLTSTGPGALNALAGLADARWSSLPLLHVTSYADDGPFSGGIHESPVQTEVMGLVGRRTLRVDGPDVDGPFWSAWQACQEPAPGPVTLEIWSRQWLDPAKLGAYRTPAAPVAPVDLDPLADALRRSSSPMIYAGGGAVRGGGAATVMALAERLDAPVVTSFQGKGVATWDHPLYLGPWGTEPTVRDLFAEADLALVLGSKLSALGTGHWGLPLPERTFRVDPLADGQPHGRYPDLVPVAADCVATCRALLDMVPVPARAGSAAEDVARVRRTVLDAVVERAPVEWGFVQALQDAMPADAALGLDMNKASFWFMKYLALAPGGVHSFSSYLCMGSGVPAAIGMAETGRDTVLALVGDGGFQMSLAEIGTLAEQRYHLPVVVFADGAYGLLRDNGASETVRGAHELGISIRNPDFAAFARAFDLGYAVARTGDELTNALGDVDGPMIIEVPHAFSRHW